MHIQNLKGQPVSYRIFYYANIIFLSIFSLSVIIPLMLVISTSVSNENLIAVKGVALLPRGLSFNAYRMIMEDTLISRAFLNSVAATLIGTFVSLLITSCLAYPLSKKYLPYNRIISFAIYFTVLFNGGIIPTYLLVKQLGLLDKFWALIIPFLVTPWFMILLRNFFGSLPVEIEESARIDGCSELKILFSIVLPLSLPAIATISLFYAVQYWNNWFGPMLYINNKRLLPIQVILRNMILSAENIGSDMDSSNSTTILRPKETLKMAVTVVAMIPIMSVYPFLQKYFAKGLLVGAVKG